MYLKPFKHAVLLPTNSFITEYFYEITPFACDQQRLAARFFHNDHIILLQRKDLLAVEGEHETGSLPLGYGQCNP
jgi:hypothetical protein